MKSLSQFLKVPEVAKLLNISTTSLYAWVRAKRVPYTRVTREILFDPDELQAWIERKSCRPAH